MARRPSCVCGRKFDEDVGLRRHQNYCKQHLGQKARRKRDRQEADLDEGLMERERQLVEAERRRRFEQEAAVDRLVVRQLEIIGT